MAQGFHIALTIITLITLAISIGLLVVALKIQKDLKQKLDKAEEVITSIKDKADDAIEAVAGKIPGEPLKKLFNRIKF